MTSPLEIELSPPPVGLRIGGGFPPQDILVLPVSGPQGPPGSASTDPYVHTQASPAGTWIITHSLGHPPQVTVIDDSGQVVLPDVVYSMPNSVVTIVFSSPQTGTAYLL